MKRMDEEWEDYQWQLQQYERQTENSEDKSAKRFPGGTLGIDVGSFYVKLAKSKAILVTREGARSTFAGLIQDGDETLTGQRAFEKYYEWKQLHPSFTFMAGIDVSNSLPVVVQSALDDALERNNTGLDETRSVVVVPPERWADYDAVTKALFPDNSRVLVPAPVTAIWGAQAEKELPDVLETPVMVIDIGGTETTLSIVQKDVLLSATTIDNIGGDIYVEAVIDVLFDKDSTIRNDSMAIQRVYQAAHAAVVELNTKSSAEVNIPYIGMNMETREPEHLEERVARTVVEQMVVEHILSTKIDESKLSSHIPDPKTLPLWWMSLLTQLLEMAQMTPQQISHVLLVGGGAKHSFMEQSVRECLNSLQGADDHLVLPQARSELIAIGASSMLQNYKYDSHVGLVR
eukprot:CAMPEP_0194251764 /NCGR_PEP_ID=MMETSP0158-20130606/26138_1 /TAXON_ID=33649 /ORGANISM="Thalassionema nitzschioides, Strain L26-B" /LENGTH=402 /DNA_ID=CAMNT_0038988989 /DNA_START=274 /DNA_END=1479 /DNA_ORIENTATION=+